MSNQNTNERTKKFRRAYWITTVISWALVFGPLAGYIIYGLIVGGTVQKVGLVTVVFVALMMTIVSVLLKLHVRSTVFLLLLGIYCALQQITVLLIIMSVCTILDEFVLTPLSKMYKNKLTINKEIDKRDNSKKDETGDRG